MVRKVSDNNVTSSDIVNTIDTVVAVNPKLNTRITEAYNKSNLFVCEVLRFYPVNDKALVKILSTGQTVRCHLTHDILSSDVSLQSMVNGSMRTDEEFGNASYVQPFGKIYGIVALVRVKDVDDEYCLISCINYKDSSRLKSSVGTGEICLQAGDSKVSVTNERVNILCPELFINGLPFSEPDFDNYHTVDEINEIEDNIYDNIEKIVSDIVSDSFVNIVYPVGSIYMSVNDVDPSLLFNGTVWEQIEDTFLLSSGSSYNLGDVGGEATHTLTINEMPSHNHSRRTSPQGYAERDTSGNDIISPASGSAKAVTKTSNNTGGGQAHNNMPPYLVVNMWKRIE